MDLVEFLVLWLFGWFCITGIGLIIWAYLDDGGNPYQHDR